MTLNRLLLVAALLGLVGWWFSPSSPRGPSLPSGLGAGTAGCPLPPGVRAGAAPLQSEVPAGMAPFALADATATPLAGFSVDARVLSRKDYRSGREADFSPVDLALGWQGMSHDAVLDQLGISQGGRFYSYRWSGQPPLPPAEIVRSSANMHMIPASLDVARALGGVSRNDRVRIDGWLVEIAARDGWRWRSSTRRDDSGAGACEVIYVCSVSRL